MTRTRLLALALVSTSLAAACSVLMPDVGPLRDSLDAGPPDAGREAGNAGDGAARDGGATTWTVTVAPGGSHSFSPADVTIHVGDTVHWVWESTGHTVTSGAANADGIFCSPGDTGCQNNPTSNAGDTYDHTFTTPGTFPYFCRPHRPMMSGTIVVQ